jgi:hypothetical protein
MNRWRVGEDRGSKETDGCPLIVRIIESIHRSRSLTEQNVPRSSGWPKLHKQ